MTRSHESAPCGTRFVWITQRQRIGTKCIVVTDLFSHRNRWRETPNMTLDMQRQRADVGDQQLHQRARWPVRCANLTKTLHYKAKYTGDTTRTRENSRTRVLNATTRSSESHKHLRITTFKAKTTLQIVWYTYPITGAIAEKWHNWKRVSQWSERRCARNRSTSNVVNVMFDWRCSSEKVCSYDNGKRE